MNGKIVNLNQTRKQRGRTERTKKADENAVKFGRSKAQKTLEKTRTDKADQDLDGHARDTP